MINVNMSLHGIKMSGHACHMVNGQDIVCSAISALTCSMINSMEALTNNRIRAETGPGKTVVEWKELDERGRILVDSWFLGLVEINREYNCIEFDWPASKI